MGPASENAGYAKELYPLACCYKLQWVQRPRTPVMLMDEFLQPLEFQASMGPASENAGYGSEDVLGPIQDDASMGPASENAGYESLAPLRCFSTA